MSFRSKAQWRECYRRKDPDWDCDEFAEESPPFESLPEYSRNGDELSYLYHVTFFRRLPGIARRGLISGAAPSIGGTSLDEHRRGAIFLTVYGGLPFWQERAAGWAYHYADDLYGEGYIPVVLRVRDEGVLVDACDTDVPGTEDAGAYAVKCLLDQLSPEDLEVYWGGDWLPVESFEEIDILEAFDHDDDGMYLLDRGPNFVGETDLDA